MRTVRYYTKGGSYTGWEKLRYRNILSYKSWLDSGNTIKLELTEITTFEQLKQELMK